MSIELICLHPSVDIQCPTNVCLNSGLASGTELSGLTNWLRFTGERIGVINPLSVSANSQNGNSQNNQKSHNSSESNIVTVCPQSKTSFSAGSVSNSTAHWSPHGTAGTACPLTFTESRPWLVESPGTSIPGPASQLLQVLALHGLTFASVHGSFRHVSPFCNNFTECSQIRVFLQCHATALPTMKGHPSCKEPRRFLLPLSDLTWLLRFAHKECWDKDNSCVVEFNPLTDAEIWQSSH